MFGNDGTLVDLTPPAAWGVGRSGGDLVVEGAGFVNVPDSTVDRFDHPAFTVAGWGYLEGTIDDYATIASREDGTTIDQHYHISINSRGEVPAFWIKTEDGLWLLQGTTAVTRQTWVHIAGTYDGTTARLYVDGNRSPASQSVAASCRTRRPSSSAANGNGMGDANVTERFPGRSTRSCSTAARSAPPEIAQLHDGALFASPSRSATRARVIKE